MPRAEARGDGTYWGINPLRNLRFYDRVEEILTIAEEKACGVYRTIAQKR